MRAILLAAGVGQRLSRPGVAAAPKCLLRYDGKTLLERHLLLLRAVGVKEVVIAVGFEQQQIEGEVDRLGLPVPVQWVVNPRYRLGSVLTVHAAAAQLTRGGDVLLMDADVLYDERIAHALVHGGRGGSANRVLLDRAFEPGDEPVKLCVKDGVPVELRKRVDPGVHYDTLGESVGFFRFTEAAAARLAAIVEDYAREGRGDQPHEEAVRDLLLERTHRFEVADVTGAPWIEIDFPADVERARADILPKLIPLRG